MKKIILIFNLFLSCFIARLVAQNSLKSFQWNDYLPYNKAYSVTQQGNKIYACANECAFCYNKDDGSYQRLSKVTGLSDIEPVLIRNNPNNDALLIIFRNSNIDILKNGNITNAPDLYTKSNVGNKTVNSVTFKGNLAYLACAFGIVVYDTDALQFGDTYIIGPGGTNVNVYQVAYTPTTIYAATSKGIFYAPLNSNNLASYTNWTQVTQLPVQSQNGVFNGIVYFGGNILASYSKNLSTNQNAGASQTDTLYKFDGSIWSKNPFNAVDGIISLSVSDDNNQLIIINNNYHSFSSYNTTGQLLLNTAYGFANAAPWLTKPQSVIPDPNNSGYYWVADSYYGLLNIKTTSQNVVQYKINGPASSGCAEVQLKDDRIIIAPTFLGYQKFNAFFGTGVSSYSNNNWVVDIHNPPHNIQDLDCVAFDNNDKTHFYAGSFGEGLIEILNDSMVAQYTYSNSIISTRNFPGSTDVQVTSLFSDFNNNLWITTNDNPTFITVKKNDNTWTKLDFSNLVPNIQYMNTDQIIVDSSNMVFVASYGTGVFVYKNDGNYSQPNASNSKLLINLAGKGGLPSLYPNCLAEDKSGDVWVGTDQGIYVFYNPSSILTQSSGWDAQPIYVQQNGQTQLLLQTDLVTTIFVDGANNKWVGTNTSGLFCFSPDGQKQLYNFTAQNSPLFSNNILDVKVNPNTGEVFIATDKGLQSFQNTTTEGNTNFTDVYAYPNPVKPGYSGPILIHGMISGAKVKIIDAGGNFVFQTTSEGGQATWNGQNYKGQRVASGIYMVVCETPDGSQKKLTKIMLLN